MKEYNFMRHALSYTGENNLADVILAVEREKYRRHIRQELYDDPESLELIMSGINYMIYTVVPLNNDISTVAVAYPITWGLTSLAYIIYFRYVKKYKIGKMEQAA